MNYGVAGDRHCPMAGRVRHKELLEMSDKILVYAPNWIGDAIMAVPMVQAARQVFPDAYLTMFCKQWVAGVYRFLPDIDDIITFTREERKTRTTRSHLIQKVRSEGFDRAFILPDSFSTARLIFQSQIPERVGYRDQFRSLMLTHRLSPNEVAGWHRSDKYMHVLHPFSSDLPYGTAPRLATPEIPDIASLCPECDPAKLMIGLNPQAVATSRRWPLSRWAELIRLLTTNGTQFILFGGPHDRDRSARIVREAEGNVIDMTGRLPLQDSIALMSRCDLFVTNDSGLMHVANALGVPTVGLYGAADISITGLRGNIYRNINADVYCSPCVKNTCPNTKEPLICLTSITPEWVASEARDLMDADLRGEPGDN